MENIVLKNKLHRLLHDMNIQLDYDQKTRLRCLLALLNRKVFSDSVYDNILKELIFFGIIESEKDLDKL